MSAHLRLILLLTVGFVVAGPALGLENSARLPQLAPVALGVTAASAVPICRLDSAWPLTGWAWVCEV
jgi:hypothetical protein